MKIKEELEKFLGEPIQVFKGDPLTIPCIETSDAEKLCKNPLISVHMTTYNHEPYIRQAIVGVMMQQTDFEFELIIGEDCSQDKTREICFEYQKKYPDKIRVLWWHENVSKLGGNSRRVTARCRGEFIAFCEGDDNWTDPLKLQKQVDLIRKTNAVMCVANSEWYFPNGEVEHSVFKGAKTELTLPDVVHHYFHTSTYLLRRDVYLACKQRYPEFVYWYDTVTIACMATMGTLCLLPEVVSVYRWTGKGVGGNVDDARRLRLLGLQAIQFLASSNPEIVACYEDWLEERFSWIYFAQKDGSFTLSLRERRTLLSWYTKVLRKRSGWWQSKRTQLRFILQSDYPRLYHLLMRLRRRGLVD